MKTVRVHSRKDRPSIYVEWREPTKVKGKIKNVRKNLAFPTKALANKFAKEKFIEINSDRCSVTDTKAFDDAFKDYLIKYEIENLSKSAQQEASITLKQFDNIAGPFLKCSDISRKHIDYFILEIKKPNKNDRVISDYTIKKKVGQLKAFINWLVDNDYHQGGVKFPKVKVSKKIVKALTNEEIATLISVCPSLAWIVRILLSLVTGLRASTIDNMPLKCIDIKRGCLDSKSDKTNKIKIDFPLPKNMIILLKWYIRSLPKNQTRLFADKNVKNIWNDEIRINAKLPNATRQQLRQTSSTIFQMISSINSAKELLEHSNSRVTQEFYTDEAMVLRWKVNQLPIKYWLGIIKE